MVLGAAAGKGWGWGLQRGGRGRCLGWGCCGWVRRDSQPLAAVAPPGTRAKFQGWGLIRAVRRMRPHALPGRAEVPDSCQQEPPCFWGAGVQGLPPCTHTSASCQAFYRAGPAGAGAKRSIPRVPGHQLPSPCGFLPGCSCSSPGCCTAQPGVSCCQGTAGPAEPPARGGAQPGSAAAAPAAAAAGHGLAGGAHGPQVHGLRGPQDELQSPASARRPPSRSQATELQQPLRSARRTRSTTNLRHLFETRFCPVSPTYTSKTAPGEPGQRDGAEAARPTLPTPTARGGPGLSLQDPQPGPAPTFRLGFASSAFTLSHPSLAGVPELPPRDSWWVPPHG